MDIATLERLNAARAGRRAAVLVTDLSGGAPDRLVTEDELASGALSGDPALLSEVRARLRSGRSGRVAIGGRDLFLNVQVPEPRLVLLGAVHISQALAPMAIATGFAVTIVDPRTAFATPERFAGLDLLAEWPQDALPRIGLDAHTAFAALTHDPKIDDPGVAAALDAGCFYVGALGSRKTHGRRRDRLAAAGRTPAEIDRIRAPIGLPIGAATPAEIAVSILAEIVAARRLEPDEASPVRSDAADAA